MNRRMRDIKVSIILPSLNVAGYIEECLNSVTGQELEEIEIICVDAGSTDGTLDIIHEFEKRDSRVQVIISERKSYGYQMNLGMKSARGEYIGIVETDDYVPSYMYKELYKTAKDNQADFVRADFYRFTGEGGNQDRELNALSADKSYYNRIITPGKEQECFLFPMNTWCGIYRREFIKENGILHNETPGASYQDNGFWFQTFVYAERGFFVNKPYYMNRRDNPGSSVFNKGKIYCICDEYEFIYKNLENNGLWDMYRDIFCFKCYQTYLWSLFRIADEYKKEFIMRFSEDFTRLRDSKELGLTWFKEKDKRLLWDLMENPEEFYRKNFRIQKETFEKICGYTDIIIYGAGMVGKKVLKKLIEENKKNDIIGFAVTDKADNLSNCQDLQIYGIDELVSYKENALVVIATTAVYQEEIRNTLRERGFKNVIVIPEGAFTV